MKLIEYKLNEISRFADFFRFMPKDCMILDIETTGLHKDAKVMLIGLVYINAKSEFVATQIFDDDGNSEKELLSTLLDIYKKSNTVQFITFNGASFDIPFINRRLTTNGFDTQIEKDLNIDLMRKAKKALCLDKYTLKSVEQSLGIHRTDTISGYESLKLYENYLSNLGAVRLLQEKIEKDSDYPKLPTSVENDLSKLLSNTEMLEEKILLHNFDDIVNLLPLTQILKPSDFLKSVWDSSLGTITILEMNNSSHLLTLKLYLHSPISKEVHLNSSGISVMFSGSHGVVRIPVHTHEGLFSYVSLDSKSEIDLTEDLDLVVGLKNDFILWSSYTGFDTKEIGRLLMQILFENKKHLSS